MEVNRNGARGLGCRGSAWPADAVFDRDGLSIGGVAAEDLAAEHGTPVVVYDADEIRDRCRELAARFPSALYAVKAFTARPAIRIAIEEGLGLLVASGGELTACLRAGAEPVRIAFHGNNKSDEELELAVGSGVGLVIADDLDELARLDRVAAAAGAMQATAFVVLGWVLVGSGVYSFVAATITVVRAEEEERSLVVLLSVAVICAVFVLLGLAMIRWGRGLRTSPTPIKRKTMQGGCLGAVLGAFAFFLLCFQVTPQGEGQLACIAFPFIGALVGGGLGAVVGRLTVPRSASPPDSAKP